jgi:hypothetical protein
MCTGSLLSTWSMPASAAAFSCSAATPACAQTHGRTDARTHARTHGHTHSVCQKGLTHSPIALSNNQHTRRKARTNTGCCACSEHRNATLRGILCGGGLTWATLCSVACNAASSLASSAFMLDEFMDEFVSSVTNAGQTGDAGAAAAAVRVGCFSSDHPRYR